MLSVGAARCFKIRPEHIDFAVARTLSRDVSSSYELNKLHSDTIIGVPYGEPYDDHQPLHSMLQDGLEVDASIGTEVSRRLFRIRMADSDGRRADASILVNRMYATRGYRTTAAAAAKRDDSGRITLVASEHDSTIGTISVGFDSPSGLLVDQLFGSETDELRRAGHRLCEFTKLAMDSVVHSRRVLASLFHVAYIYSHRVFGGTSLLIEVNPRHVNYYKRMLGFKVIGPERLNLRVNAPAVLLCLDLAHAEQQIARFGGRPERSSTERSLYPYFFSVADEAGIVGRMTDAPSRYAPVPKFARSAARSVEHWS